MTGRIAATSMDGSPISQNDLDRMAAEERLHTARQRATVRVVAAAATDVADARMLLDILGLGPDVVAAARAEMPAAHPTPEVSAAPAPRRRKSAAAA